MFVFLNLDQQKRNRKIDIAKQISGFVYTSFEVPDAFREIFPDYDSQR